MGSGLMVKLAVTIILKNGYYPLNPPVADHHFTIPLFHTQGQFESPPKLGVNRDCWLKFNEALTVCVLPASLNT